MIPVYNCADYIPEALHSVLAQCIGEEQMQIEVVDDASTDADVEAIVREIGGGRVAYHRQPENVGSLRNFETCINRARGRLVHLLHGDDRVKQGFYRKIAFLFEQFPAAGAAFSNYLDIDSEGKTIKLHKSLAEKDEILKDGLLKIAEHQYIQYVSIVVRREVYEHLGSFYGGVYGEDWEMWARIARVYSIAYSPETLAEYRKHQGSISWPKNETGQNTKDLAIVLNIIENYLPDDKKCIMSKTKKSCALFCLAKANIILGESGNELAALTQVKLALSLNKSPLLYYHIVKFYIKLVFKKY
ncbi:glycosyltransferase family 2 protein [Pontibacter pamirensis]|uniref:glycosyltransferase family 2 protein n=1 Tax=Pontibacter pamirensis TaxID=2562824 RepID=UPI0013895F94|nr:glycosyltransferase [Pontibacter pamirensis]